MKSRTQNKVVKSDLEIFLAECLCVDSVDGGGFAVWLSMPEPFDTTCSDRKSILIGGALEIIPEDTDTDGTVTEELKCFATEPANTKEEAMEVLSEMKKSIRRAVRKSQRESQ